MSDSMLSKTVIATDKAPAAIGPYSQAVLSGSTLYCSGSIPLDPATGEVVGATVKEQTAQVLKNIAGVLEAAGFSAQDVVKTTCFLTDLGTFADFNEEYATYFTGNPARSTVEVSALPKGVLVEIELIATKS